MAQQRPGFAGAATARITAGLGLAAVVLFAVGVVVGGGAPPATSDSAESVLAHYSDHRGAIIIGLTIGGLAVAFIAAFLAGLRRWLRDRDPATGLAVDVGLATGLVVFAIALTGNALAVVAAYLAPDLPAETARLLNTAFAIVVNISDWPTVVSSTAFGIAIWRSGLPARWVGGLSLLVAAVHVLGGVSFARDGAWAPTGAVPVLAPLLYLVWVLAVAVVLLRRRAA